MSQFSGIELFEVRNVDSQNSAIGYLTNAALYFHITIRHPYYIIFLYDKPKLFC